MSNKILACYIHSKYGTIPFTNDSEHYPELKKLIDSGSQLVITIYPKNVEIMGDARLYPDDFTNDKCFIQTKYGSFEVMQDSIEYSEIEMDVFAGNMELVVNFDVIEHNQKEDYPETYSMSNCIRLVDKVITENNYNQGKPFYASNGAHFATIVQLARYLYIYKNEDGICNHYHVNDYIEKNDGWGYFNRLRSHNTHASGYTVDGIRPIFYAIVCDALNLKPGDGTKLVDYKSY